MADRILLSAIRQVSSADVDAYDRSWESVRTAVSSTGAHAWRFRAVSTPARHIEFLEFRAGNDPRVRPEIARALEELNSRFPGDHEEWRDAAGGPREQDRE